MSRPLACAALVFFALGIACTAARPLPIVIRDPVTLRLASQWRSGTLEATSGKNRCEVTGGFRKSGPLPDGGVTVLTIADICVVVRCGAEKEIFGHQFSCDCRGEEVLEECFDDLDP